MTNVLLICISEMPSYNLTVKDFQCYSRELGFNLRNKLSRYIVLSDLTWCDILICVRGNDSLSSYLARIANGIGKKVILALDDDLLEYDAVGCHPTNNRKARKSLRQVLDYTDYIVTTSRYLGEKYNHKYGIQYALLDTIVQEEDIVVTPHKNDVISIVYAASSGHKVFFEEIVNPALSKISDLFSEKISLYVVGLTPNIVNVRFPVEFVPQMKFDDYQKYMRHHHFDIGLAPLMDSNLCRSKYYNKFIEYSKYGICGIYSNVLPYNLIVNNKVNGLLVENNAESWIMAISELVENNKLRECCRENAKKQLLRDFSSMKMAKKLSNQIPEINTYKSHIKRKKPILPMGLFFLLHELKRRFLNLVYKYCVLLKRQSVINNE